jgi:Flp pilus assembly protein TadG
MNRERPRGQATVEFALILPLVVACMMCVLATGVVVYDHLSLADLSRSAVRAAVASDDPPSAARSVVTHTDSSVQIRTTMDDATGLVHVKLTRQRKLPLWFLGRVLPHISVTAGATMLREPTSVIGDGLG